MSLLNDKPMLLCEYCNSVYIPPENLDGVRVLGEPGEAHCPVCKDVLLVLASLEDIRLQHCPRCQGLLFKVGSFQSAMRKGRLRFMEYQSRPTPLNPDELQRKLDCPYCSKPMDTHPYGGPGNIVIDNCPRCWVNWLDYKEFRRVITAPERVRARDDDPLAWIPLLKEDRLDD